MDRIVWYLGHAFHSADIHFVLTVDDRPRKAFLILAILIVLSAKQSLARNECGTPCASSVDWSLPRCPS